MAKACFFYLLKALPEVREDKHSPSWLFFISEPQNFHPDKVSCTALTPVFSQKKGLSNYHKVFMVSIPYQQVVGGQTSWACHWMTGVLVVPHQIKARMLKIAWTLHLAFHLQLSHKNCDTGQYLPWFCKIPDLITAWCFPWDTSESPLETWVGADDCFRCCEKCPDTGVMNVE